ncbi:PspC domain-containing protein [Sphingomonas nostoxanthinifaciens]|uniref:PspC domain-containing protein n=1 Tax=Sphingomonas nostoxanthinifaciens TaxID=2872652 RepID=UPI001CC1D089|nr:PspC domain-containing protein [Sphingomonas nostoxanthinifaciens]UAK25213.1 PspC domain-containing protein [Sphingomonas nostoxanthinifaciens]
MQTTITPVADAPTVQRDNMLGICHSLGETFGFNPLWLRIVLAALLLASVEVALAVYAICGVAVLVGHLLAPRKAMTPTFI